MNRNGDIEDDGDRRGATILLVVLAVVVAAAVIGIGYAVLRSADDPSGDQAEETSTTPSSQPTSVPASTTTTGAVDDPAPDIGGTTEPDEATGSPGPIEACRLGPGTGDAVGLAFPRSEDRLPSVGRVDVAVVFADYADVPADRTPAEAFELIAPGSTEFFAAVSYGQMELVLHPHLRWLRLGPADDYRDAILTFEGHRDFIQEAVTAAGDDLDLAGMDAVVVIGTPNAFQVRYGPTWMGYSGDGGRIDPDGAGITNGVTSGADLTVWGWKWLPHELGHSLGLPDLYMTGVDGGYTRPFGIMDLISSAAPEYFAYERWYVGWLDDSQMWCVDGGGEGLLSPIEVPGGTKAMVVPRSPTRAVVVESRRALGYDAALTEEGALVYVVDVTVPTLEGPIRVENERRPLRAGQSMTVDGVTITVVDADDEGDTVRIDVEP